MVLPIGSVLCLIFVRIPWYVMCCNHVRILFTLLIVIRIPQVWSIDLLFCVVIVRIPLYAPLAMYCVTLSESPYMPHWLCAVSHCQNPLICPIGYVLYLIVRIPLYATLAMYCVSSESPYMPHWLCAVSHCQNAWNDLHIDGWITYLLCRSIKVNLREPPDHPQDSDSDQCDYTASDNSSSF